MSMLASLFAATLAAIPAPPSPDEISKDPDKAGAVIIGGAFLFGCMERLDLATSAMDYADGSAALGTQLKTTQEPALADLPIALEGVHGDTCRATYHGTHVTELWTVLSDFKIAKMNAACTEGPTTPTRVVLTCKATHHTPAYTTVVERGVDSFSASMTWQGPKTP